MLWGARRSAAKERSDFQTVDEYRDYIQANTVKGTRVECCVPGVHVGVGEQGTVVSNNFGYQEVSWDNGRSEAVDYWQVKLVASVGKMNLMAD